MEIQEAGGDWSSPLRKQMSTTSLDINIDNLVSGKGLADAPHAYEIRVKATGNSGDSAYSDTITIIDTPIKSINGTSPQGGVGQALVKWKPIPEALEYNIRWRQLDKDARGKIHSNSDLTARSTALWNLDSTSLLAEYKDESSINVPGTLEHPIAGLNLYGVYGVPVQLQDGGWLGLLWAGLLRVAFGQARRERRDGGHLSAQ